MTARLSIVASILIASPLMAAQHDHGATRSPYADLTDRSIKSLSGEQIEELRSGAGAGFALAAELNGLPGPKHVLEMEDQLRLSDEQREQLAVIREQMSAAATELGEQIIALEAGLDSSFATGAATATSVASTSEAIGQLTGRLRATHLNAHLATVEVLSPEQVESYNRLRGYSRE